ncbi:MAG: hypothetical protein AAF357_03345 [Verrucomicrobiota bacterium]
MDSIIHDIKTERQNVSDGLPRAYRLVPVAFYVITVASIFLSLYFFLSKKAYETTEQAMGERLAQAQSESSDYASQREAIVEESQQAEGIARWLEGSHPLQPVVVSVGRSMAKDSTVAELSLDRNPDIPAHTFMQLKVDGGGTEQIETTLSSIYALHYQTYSAQQVKGRDSTDFQATLIYSNK